jgi:cation transporter-like permease
MAFKDPAQGAAAIIFLIIFTALAYVSAHAFATRRPRFRMFCIFFCSVLKLGAQVAGIGWAIALYTNFSWLIAYLVSSALLGGIF